MNARIAELKVIAQAIGEEFTSLRGKAMQCVGLMGIAVGAERFAPDALEVMEILLSGCGGQALDANHPQTLFVIESCAQICTAVKAEFVPYV